jgi:hypothetical protein
MSNIIERKLVKLLDPSTRQNLMVSRMLDTTGDGTGSKIAIDTQISGLFLCQPPAGQVFNVERMIIHVQDATLLAAGYGGLSALSNGIEVKIVNDSGVLVDLTDDTPVKSLAHWGRYCYDSQILGFGAGDDFFSARWTFGKAGQPIQLDGDSNERIEVSINDDLTGLVDHTFLIQGSRVK